MKLTTERLILREPIMKDAKDLVKILNSINISENFRTIPYPYTLKMAKSWIKNCIKDTKEKPRKSYSFVIELKPQKVILGAVGLAYVNKYEEIAGLWYWLSKNYWRQGITFEASSSVLDFAFNKIRLRRINASAFGDNESSNNLLKKLGFKYEGTRIKNMRAKSNGKIHDENIYGLLREDYVKKR